MAVTVMLMVSIGIDTKKRTKHANSESGFEKIVVNYGTDIPNLAGDHTRYLYGPGSILVAHGANENITVGSLEQAVDDYQKLILHALESTRNEEL